MKQFPKTTQHSVIGVVFLKVAGYIYWSERRKENSHNQSKNQRKDFFKFWEILFLGLTVKEIKVDESNHNIKIFKIATQKNRFLHTLRIFRPFVITLGQYLHWAVPHHKLGLAVWGTSVVNQNEFRGERGSYGSDKY